MTTYKSYSSEETKCIAAQFALRLTRPKRERKRALVVALNGELGSGKTTFVQGFLAGLGLKKRALSPTFILVRKTIITHGNFKSFFHIDAYRIRHIRELVAMDIEKIFENPKHIVLIEWANNIREAIPRGTEQVNLSYGSKENERIIAVASPSGMINV